MSALWGIATSIIPLLFCAWLLYERRNRARVITTLRKTTERLLLDLRPARAHLEASFEETDDGAYFHDLEALDEAITATRAALDASP